MSPCADEPDGICNYQDYWRQQDLEPSIFTSYSSFFRIPQTNIMDDSMEDFRFTNCTYPSPSTSPSSGSYMRFALPSYPNLTRDFTDHHFGAETSGAAASIGSLPTEERTCDPNQATLPQSQMEHSNYMEAGSMPGLPDYYRTHFFPPESFASINSSSRNGLEAASYLGQWPEMNQDENLEPFHEIVTADDNNAPQAQIKFQKVPCKDPQCFKSYTKKADMERHYNSEHERAGVICGDCRNYGREPKLKRKDHFHQHLSKHHGSGRIIWKSFKECPWETCRPANDKQLLRFSTQESLNLHLLQKHQGETPASEKASLSQETSSDELSKDNDELASSKRTSEHEHHGVKRPRCEDAPSMVQETHHRLLSMLRSTAVSDPSFDEENSTKMEDFPNEERTESYVLNVSPKDFARAGPFLNIISKYIQQLVTQSSSQTPETPYISFDMPKRRIKLYGPPNFVNPQKAIIEKELELIRLSKNPVPLANISKNSPDGMKDHLRADFYPSTVTQKVPRDSANIFAIRKKEDSHILALWMKDILPALFKILDEFIGGEYSTSLVREGASVESASPVIRIESPQVPQPTTRAYILEQLDKECRIRLTDAQIQVQFLTGSLVFLAGGPQKEIENDRRRLPFYTRYWKYPGMGASIGLFCTEVEFATLGCYVEVDSQIYILTIDHFIDKSYRTLVEDSIEGKQTLTSPALSKVKRMTEELGYLRESLEGELGAEWYKKFGDQSVNPPELHDLSQNFFDIMEKQDFVENFLNELNKENAEFKIGSLAARCKPNTTAPLSRSHSTLGLDSLLTSVRDIGEGEMRHRIDWALFKVDSRIGKNRHRYKYDHESGSTDFFPTGEHVDHGEGLICQETCVVEGNERVCLVGQTSGRLEGEVSPALRGVAYKGCKTLEHHLIIRPEDKNQGREYAGDSGAVVLRVIDNNMLGLVWGCYNGEPIFTPIGTVFADIKDNLTAKNVDLPKVRETAIPPIPSEPTSTIEARLISGSELDVPKMRPFKRSDIELPNLSDEVHSKKSKHHLESLRKRWRNGGLGNLSPTAVDSIERPLSPVPDLLFSSASSPMSTPASPSPPLRELTPISNVPDEPIIVVGEDVEASWSPHLKCDIYSLEDGQLEKLLQEKLNFESKISIPYFLCNTHQKRRKRLRSPQQFPVMLTRSWKTWALEA